MDDASIDTKNINREKKTPVDGKRKQESKICE